MKVKVEGVDVRLLAVGKGSVVMVCLLVDIRYTLKRNAGEAKEWRWKA